MTRALNLSAVSAVGTETWEALAKAALRTDSLDRPPSTTRGGLPLKALYTRADWPDAAAGAAPLSHVAVDGRWDIRQFAPGTDIASTCATVMEEVAGGATSVWVSSDTIRSRSDLDAVLAASGEAAIAFDAGSGAPALGDFLLQPPFGKGSRPCFLSYDPFALGNPPADAARLAAAFAKRPGWRALAADTRPYHNAGASEAQEIGAALATAIAHLRALAAAGLSLGSACAQMSFIFAIDCEFIPGIVKLRAFRRCLARLLEACGDSDPMREIEISAVSSERMVAARDPQMNILRAGIATAAAVFGGADAITTLPHDVRSGAPTGDARRIARNLQIILMEEAHLARVADPGAGSFAIERLTEDLAALAWKEFQKIDAQGGIIAALESGSLASGIGAVWERRRAAIATRKHRLVGVSDFTTRDHAWTAVPPPSQHARFPVHHDDDVFEGLRTAGGAPRSIYIVPIGTEADYAPRAGFARSLFAAGGITTTLGPGGTDAVEAAAAFLDSGERVAVLCSSDTLYAEHALAFAAHVKQAGARYVYFAGRPGELEARLRQAGVDEFIHEGIDAVALLQRAHTVLGP